MGTASQSRHKTGKVNVADNIFLEKYEYLFIFIPWTSGHCGLG